LKRAKTEISCQISLSYVRTRVRKKVRSCRNNFREGRGSKRGNTRRSRAWGSCCSGELWHTVFGGTLYQTDVSWAIFEVLHGQLQLWTGHELLALVSLFPCLSPRAAGSCGPGIARTWSRGPRTREWKRLGSHEKVQQPLPLG